ncbi:cyclin-dependent kinase inhibitor 1 isoform X1 [Anguilla rostrata]|uniref:cyclin-dependent kinase inhibitor 1 isoform X1 n=2 Tax=Anguilla rostrata TaxID=7938 RepID=UPI0030D10CA6
MCRTMSTINKRILTALGNGPTCRRLFGPVDREQLREECRNLLRKDLEDASRRWGFDFATETPMEGGDFQWEGVVGARVPALYRSRLVGSADARRPGASASRAASGPTDKENVPCTPTRCQTQPQNLEMTPEKNHSQRLKRKQTNITDFYQAKRRVVGTPRKSGQ